MSKRQRAKTTNKQITCANPIQRTRWRYRESPWITTVDGITNTAWKYNRNTGKRKQLYP